MDKLEPEETKAADLPRFSLVRIEKPSNCVIASRDYIEVAVNINCSDRAEGSALAKEAREIGKAIVDAVAAARGEAA